MEKIIALVDCNSFYCSCERVFNPKLKGKPVVVLSNNDGCIVSRTDEAKRLGIDMAIPAHLIEKELKANGVIMCSSNYTLYHDMSRRVMDTLRYFSPEIEEYSIDEAFLDLTTFIGNYDILEYASHIRKTILQWTGIPVSVGIGSSKVLAKIANKRAKKIKEANGVFVFRNSEEIDNVLKITPVGDIWGIKRRLAYRLSKVNIVSGYDLKQANPKQIDKIWGIVGMRMVAELNGMSCIEWTDVAPAKKNIISGKSFGRPVTDFMELKEAIAMFCMRASEKLRQQKSVAKVIGVGIETNPFKQDEAQYNATRYIKLLVPTSDASKIIKIAVALLKRIYRPGLKYKKGIIFLSDFYPEENVQAAFGVNPDSVRSRKIMRSLAELNIKYGQSTLLYGACGYNHKWRMRQQKLSLKFTTCLREILTVKA